MRHRAAAVNRSDSRKNKPQNITAKSGQQFKGISKDNHYNIIGLQQEPGRDGPY